MKPTISAVVPCLEKRGGIRQFLEIGNILVDRGYDYTIFTDDPPNILDWFNFKGKIVDWRNGIKADKILIGDPQILPATDQMEGEIFMWVIAGIGPYKEMYAPYRGKFKTLVNGRYYLKDYPEASLCELGVDTKHFTPKKRRVLYYSGRSAQKQVHIIERALSNIDSVELFELKGLGNDELVQAYHSGDFFVAWQMEGGFAGMVAEALACGLPVVTNGNCCAPFIEKVIVVNTEQELRDFFENPMKDFTWEKTVDNLLKIIL